MKLDPSELRRRNMIRPEQMPYTNAMGQVYDSGRFEQILGPQACARRLEQLCGRAAKPPASAANCAGAASPLPGMDRRHRPR
jgi:carbon-monoxide dehydrogenase large subunit